MTISVGDKIPAVTMIKATAEGPQPVSSTDYFAGKKVALFSVPGAFTPTCSTYQLPGFENGFADFAALGVDEIYCMSVNDAFVMNKWAEAQGLKNVKVIPDGSGEFTRRMGMLVRKDNLGFGLRSWRYAAIVNDGKIEAWFEEPGLCDNHGEDPYGISSPETVLDWLREDAKGQAA